MMNCPTPLALVLQAVATSLPDATNHYFLKANYYALVEDDETRCWMAAMWLNAETTRNLEMGTDELQLDVLLDGRHPDHWTRVRIPYTEIWDILYQRAVGGPSANGWKTSLYYEPAAMQMPPVG